LVIVIWLVIESYSIIGIIVPRVCCTWRWIVIIRWRVVLRGIVWLLTLVGVIPRAWCDLCIVVIALIVWLITWWKGIRGRAINSVID
jgi:hypothetical protein